MNGRLRKTTISMAAAIGVLAGAAFGEECAFAGAAPAMPDAAVATAEDRAATISAIKDYQAALGVYRECLETTLQNEDLADDVRQAALDAFNKTVDEETKMVEAWQAFNTAYQNANS